MKNNYKIVAITPAGRKRYMEILYKYIYKNKHILDRWDIWVNTQKEEDLTYLKELGKNDSSFVNLIYSDYPYNNWGHPDLNLTPFWNKATDEDTIYVRFDDDVVFIADGTIENLVDFRIKNPQYFLAYPFIINNTHHSRNLQDRLLVDKTHGQVRCENELFGHGIRCPVGLYSVGFVRQLHQVFLNHYSNNSIEKLMITEPIVWQKGSQISINCVCWTGKFMKSITPLNNGILPSSEEGYLTIDATKQYDMSSVTVPNTLIVHFLFSTQRPQDELYDVLKHYKDISDNL